MGNFKTKLQSNKYGLGLFFVLILILLSIVFNTILIDSIDENIRISITAFTAASACVLPLKYLVYRIHRRTKNSTKVL